MPKFETPGFGLIRPEKELSGAEEFVMKHYQELYQKAQAHPENPEEEKLILELRMKYGPQTERAAIFDRIIHHFRTWWGGSVEIHRATRLDDYTNATDLIVEFIDENNKRMAVLSLDTTVPDDNLDTVRAKSKKIMDKLEDGKMGKLKYMPRNSNKRPFEELDFIPQVILALNTDTLGRLCDDVRKSVESNDEQMMKNHPYQLTMLDIVVEQLVTQREVLIEQEHSGYINSEQKKQMDAKLVQMIDIVKGVILQKENPPEGPGVKMVKSWSDYVSLHFKNHEDFLRLAA